MKIDFQNIKIRASLLFPPLIIIIICAIIVNIHTYTNFTFNIKPIQYTLIGASIWLLIGMLVIITNDFKNSIKNI